MFSDVRQAQIEESGREFATLVDATKVLEREGPLDEVEQASAAVWAQSRSQSHRQTAPSTYNLCAVSLNPEAVPNVPSLVPSPRSARWRTAGRSLGLHFAGAGDVRGAP